MSRVLVSGSVAYDRIMDFPGYFKDHFIAERLHNINVSFSVESFEENFGGTAGNIAYNLALLSVEPRIIATAGGDFERYRAHLKENNIDPTSVRVAQKGLTSSAYVITDKADNQIAAFSMSAGGETYQPLPDTDSFSCAIIGAGCVRDMQALPAHYRAHNIPYFYDPAQAIPVLSAEDIGDGIEGSAGVFGNDYEYNLIAQKTGWSEKQLLEKTSLIVVTYGEKGSRVVTRDGEWQIAATPVAEAVDPTGAGDAYRAGFIAAFVKGNRPEKCARLGSTLAAYTVEKYGTQTHHPTIEELRHRYIEAHRDACPL